MTDPVPITRRYLRCLLTQDQVSALGDADRAGPRVIFRIWPDFRARPHIDRSAARQPGRSLTSTRQHAGRGRFGAKDPGSSPLVGFAGYR